MSNEELRRTVRQALGIAADLNQRFRFKAAFEELQRINETLLQNRTEMEDLHQEYDGLLTAAQEGSRMRVDEARAKLDAILRQPILDFDEEQALSALHSWADHLFIEYDPLFDTYETQVNTRIDEYMDRLEADDVQREVEAQWKNARATVDKTAALDAFDKAYNFARDAQKMYPRNALLWALLEQAQRLRDEAYMTGEDNKPDPAESADILFDTTENLTPALLIYDLGRYLLALEQIQYLISELSGQKPVPIRIHHITQESPIRVRIEGVADAIQIVRTIVIPWRRQHADRIASSVSREKHLETERLQLALTILTRLAPTLSENEKIMVVARLVSPLEILCLGSL